MVEVPQNLFIIITAAFGLCIGSFLNVLIWRLPQEKGIKGRSACPNCGAQLSWVDLIPVLSFLSTKGRCRYCANKVSYRYPVIEIATGLLFGFIAWQFYTTEPIGYLILIRALVVVSFCITIFVIDLEHYLILNKLIFPAIIFAVVTNLGIDLSLQQNPLLLSSFTWGGLVAAIAAAVPFWVMWRVSKGRWMGFGDVKFMVFIGLILGFPVVVIGIFLSFMTGAVISMLLLAAKKKQMTSRIPFGTFLTVSTIISLLWGDNLWHWYAAFTGLG